MRHCTKMHRVVTDTVTVSGVQMKFQSLEHFPFSKISVPCLLAFPCTVRESIESIPNCAFDRMQINGGEVGGGGGGVIN